MIDDDIGGVIYLFPRMNLQKHCSKSKSAKRNDAKASSIFGTCSHIAAAKLTLGPPSAFT